MDLTVPVVDGHLTLINLGPVDPGQDIVIEFLPLALGIGRVAPGVGEQVNR